jgi:DNA-directed RNA polymerase
MSWITPLGLPVTQPYRREAHYAVKTVLQNVILTLNNDFLPVASKKQKSAFPPNYVHSLDATHMLLTALKMRDKKLTFAAVHDSYWTHAADVETMSEVRIP